MTVCEIDNCAGCMLCLDVCSKDAIRIEDNISSFNAVIDEDKCVNCNSCHNKCPQNNVPVKKIPTIWYQGWNKDEEMRQKSPSGGIGMALAKSFIQEGGYVCSCMFKKGEFQFEITNKWEDAIKFSGSKYVKSNPVGIYKKILNILKDENKVLFIGLPCQAAAVKNYIPNRYHDKLYLVDLICHGTPSPRLLEKFLNQYSKTLKEIRDIKFRIKAKMQLVVDDEGIVCKGVSDKYTIGFLNGLTYTNNCYSCNYASGDRVTDITIGDSWGTNLEKNEIKRGISLMVCSTAKGNALLKSADIELLDVDEKIAKENNEQLVRPMTRPNAQKRFYSKYNTRKFNSLIFTAYSKQCLKQDIKKILIKLNLVH